MFYGAALDGGSFLIAVAEVMLRVETALALKQLSIWNGMWPPEGSI